MFRYKMDIAVYDTLNIPASRYNKKSLIEVKINDFKIEQFEHLTEYGFEYNSNITSPVVVTPLTER